MAEKVVHLSSVAGSPLLDSGGARLGRVEDVIAQLGMGDGMPLVTGLKARIGGRELFVPINRIAGLGPAAARTSTTKLNLAQFERRPEAGDAVDRHEQLAAADTGLQAGHQWHAVAHAELGDHILDAPQAGAPGVLQRTAGHRGQVHNLFGHTAPPEG